MFSKVFENNRKILLYSLKDHALMFKVLKVFRSIYEHIQIDL